MYLSIKGSYYQVKLIDNIKQFTKEQLLEMKQTLLKEFDYDYNFMSDYQMTVDDYEVNSTLFKNNFSFYKGMLGLRYDAEIKIKLPDNFCQSNLYHCNFNVLSDTHYYMNLDKIVYVDDKQLLQELQKNLNPDLSKYKLQWEVVEKTNPVLIYLS